MKGKKALSSDKMEKVSEKIQRFLSRWNKSLSEIQGCFPDCLSLCDVSNQYGIMELFESNKKF